PVFFTMMKQTGGAGGHFPSDGGHREGIMKLRWSVVGVVISFAAVNQAPAQYPRARPTVSPYINLLRGGNLAANYYGIIRPEQDLRRGLLNTQQALMNEQWFLGSQEQLANMPLITGNYASFQTQGRYFMTRGAGAWSAGGYLPYGRGGGLAGAGGG